MAALQASTPAFEQYFNFDTEPHSKDASFQNTPAVQAQDMYYGNSGSGLGSKLYPYPAFPRQPTTPPFEQSFMDVDIDVNMNQMDPIWPFSPLPQLKQPVVPLHKLETQLNPTPSNIQHGLATPESFGIASPNGGESSGNRDSSIEPTKIQASGNKKGKTAAKNEDNDSKPSKLVRRRNRRSRKRKDVDPSSPVEVERRSKFLERNRIAASKCRQKKKEWASDLDTRVRELQINKDSLSTLANSLKEEVLYLKGEMLKHSSCSCPQIKAYLQNQIGEIQDRARRCSHCNHREMEGVDFHSSAEAGPSSHNSPTNIDDDGMSSIVGTASAATSPVSNAASLPSDQEASLEALLTSELHPDTSDFGIAKKLERRGG